jgi:hypothetical protein
MAETPATSRPSLELPNSWVRAARADKEASGAVRAAKEGSGTDAEQEWIMEG